MTQVMHQARDVLVETWKSWNAHHTPRIGAALAYYTAFSVAPILIIAIAVAGTVFGTDAARDEVIHQMRGMLGETGAKAVQEMLTSAHHGRKGGVAAIVGAVTLLIGASSLFAELQGALNVIWEAPPRAKAGILGKLRARFLSFAMVLVIGFLLLVSLVVSATLSGLQDSFGGLTPFLAQSLNVLISLVATTILFGLIYKVLPDVEIAWKDVRVGAFVTAILFVIGKQLIGLYLGNSSLASTYGAAGSFVVMLAWIYYSAQLLLVGAEFTHVYAHRASDGPTPAASGA